MLPPSLGRTLVKYEYVETMAPVVLEYAKNGLPGITKTVKVEGSGPKPKMGDKVRINYSCFLDNGRVVAQSGLRGGDETIRIGMREMWGTAGDLGLLSMTAGEKSILICEHEFAGPEAGSGKTNVEVRLHEIIDPAEAERREQRIMLGAVGVFFLMVLTVLFFKGFHLFGW